MTPGNNPGGNDRGNNGNNGNGFDRDGNHNNRGGLTGTNGNINRTDNRGGNRGNYRDDLDLRNHPENRNRGYNAYRDSYRDNYMRHDWSRPLPPPVRTYRPAPIIYHRPVVPVGWRPYRNAPYIDRILGITFGTLFNASLDYLYYNNYFIDGYDNGVIYLRNVNMLNIIWPDVMLCYDDYGRLINSQFTYSTYYNDMSRFNRIYNDLCRVYGPPIESFSDRATWFGGSSTGYVTLSFHYGNARYYTTMIVGG